MNQNKTVNLTLYCCKVFLVLKKMEKVTKRAMTKRIMPKNMQILEIQEKNHSDQKENNQQNQKNKSK
jgi:hypothetical protein